MSATTVNVSHVKRLLGRPVAYYPSLTHCLGNVNAAILLCQLLYWTPRSQRGGWVYKTQRELTEETGLSRSQLDTGRRVLRKAGVLQEKLKGVPAKTHYRLDFIVLNRVFQKYKSTEKSNNSSLQEIHNPDCGKPANWIAENQQSITESTTETTYRDLEEINKGNFPAQLQEENPVDSDNSQSPVAPKGKTETPVAVSGKSKSPVDPEGYIKTLRGLGLTTDEAKTLLVVDEDYARAKYPTVEYQRLVRWWLRNGSDYAKLYALYADVYKRRWGTWPDKGAAQRVSDADVGTLIEAIKKHSDTGPLGFEKMLDIYVTDFIDDTPVQFATFSQLTKVSTWMANRGDEGNTAYTPDSCEWKPKSYPIDEMLAEMRDQVAFAREQGWDKEVKVLEGRLLACESGRDGSDTEMYLKSNRFRIKRLERGETIEYEEDEEQHAETVVPKLRATRRETGPVVSRPRMVRERRLRAGQS